MRKIYRNPFDKEDTIITNVTFKICNLDYVASITDTDTTVIDFDEGSIKINDCLNPIRRLRELLRAFFIITIREYGLNKDYSNGRNPKFDDASYAILSSIALHWFNKNSLNWTDKDEFPDDFVINGIRYTCSYMKDVSGQNTQNIQMGVADHMTCKIKIIQIDNNVPVDRRVIHNTFWHEYMHCLFVQANEDSANEIEYVVDNLGAAFGKFMKQFEYYE